MSCPLIVQHDRCILLDLADEGAEGVRAELSGFADLIKSPEHLHTYRMSALSLWQAVHTGWSGERMLEFLTAHSLGEVPAAVREWMLETTGRAGRLQLLRAGARLELIGDPEALAAVVELPSIAAWIQVEDGRHLLPAGARGPLKSALVRVGWPVDDRAGFLPGNALDLRVSARDASGQSFALRPYQEAAAQAFYGGGGDHAGAGVVVLPCGAGKTLVGVRAMELFGTETLVLTTNRTSVEQWRREVLDRTNLREDQVATYVADHKELGPVTVGTYQMLTWRDRSTGQYPHLDLFSSASWGLVIYDEVHLLPAPVFRLTAELQARRRLGLTATLVREDGLESEVYSLIGPCCYALPWRQLERSGHIAEALCIEVRVPMGTKLGEEYAAQDARGRARVAAENPAKLAVLQELHDRHADERILVIGQYTRQLEEIARHLGAPLITGKTPASERERLYGRFREGRDRLLVVSKVANFAIDLPDAAVAIQVSGTFGSRQEEAQRLGRVLRRKADGRGALFYTLVTRDSRDQHFAAKRQVFLAEQGYAYEVVAAEELAAAAFQRPGAEAS